MSEECADSTCLGVQVAALLGDQFQDRNASAVGCLSSENLELSWVPQHSTALHGTPRDPTRLEIPCGWRQHGTAWHSMAQQRQLSGTAELQAFCKSVAPSASLSFTLIPCSAFNVFFNVQRLCCPLKHLKDSPQKHTQIWIYLGKSCRISMLSWSFWTIYV